VRRKPSFRDLDQNTISFFFTNYPEATSVTELSTFFARFGRIREFFVPKKKNKWGRRFGFVKFLDVTKEEELNRRLKDVWWGNTKLKINRAMFGRDENTVERSE